MFKKYLYSSLTTLILFASFHSYATGNDLESYSHNKRIEILKQAETCNQKAQTQSDYKQCEQLEKTARQNFRKEMFNKRKQIIIQKLQSRLKCVQSATDIKQLKACRPKQN